MFLVITRDRKSFFITFWTPWKPNQISISSLQPQKLSFLYQKIPYFAQFSRKCQLCSFFPDLWHNFWCFFLALDDFKRKKFLETIKLCTKNTSCKNQSPGCQNLLNTFCQMISNLFMVLNHAMTKILQNYKWLQTTLHTIKILTNFSMTSSFSRLRLSLGDHLLFQVNFTGKTASRRDPSRQESLRWYSSLGISWLSFRLWVIFHESYKIRNKIGTK